MGGVLGWVRNGQKKVLCFLFLSVSRPLQEVTFMLLPRNVTQLYRIILAKVQKEKWGWRRKRSCLQTVACGGALKTFFDDREHMMTIAFGRSNWVSIISHTCLQTSTSSISPEVALSDDSCLDAATPVIHTDLLVPSKKGVVVFYVYLDFFVSVFYVWNLFDVQHRFDSAIPTMDHVFVVFFPTHSALHEENGQFQAAVGVPHVGLIVRGAWCTDRWEKIWLTPRGASRIQNQRFSVVRWFFLNGNVRFLRDFPLIWKHPDLDTPWVWGPRC